MVKELYVDCEVSQRRLISQYRKCDDFELHGSGFNSDESTRFRPQD